MSEEPEVMGENFSPPRAGRPPLVSALPIMRKVADYAQDNPQRWLAFRTYSAAECRSLRRQLHAEGFDASIATEDGKPVLYVRL